jgi:TonB-linked SusC/RagA family outer membrane protein
MKKKSLALVIMRITFVYVTIVFSLIGTALASNLNAQAILDKEITINVTNNEFSNVLSSIEKISGVKFVYSSAIIGSNRKISLSATKKPISSILNEILPPLNLTYEVVNNSIVIKRIPAPIVSSPSAMAQGVTGKVTDEKGENLIGVTVSEKGTTNTVVTNSNGDYKISVANANAVLVFSYVGYNRMEIPVGERAVVNVSMTIIATALNDVIITALGIKKESKRLGYSAEKVNTEEITTNRTTNFADALEGKVAGLDISPPAAGPGSSTKIRLRGQSSFTADNSPLLVVNGLPMSQSASSTNGYTQQVDQGDNLQGINPDDIESMTILKGSTAAALYGSRAVNGAIIITTKTGARNMGIGVEFNSNFTESQALDYTDFQYQYGQGENNIRPSSQGTAQSSGAWSFGVPFDNVPTYQFDGVQRPYAPVRNRISSFFRVAPSWTNTVALSGGTDKGSFRVSYSNQDADGIIPNNDYHKKIFNIGINYKLTKQLSAQVYMNYSHEFNNNPPVLGVQAMSIPTFIYRFANSISLDVLKAAATDANGNETPTSRFNTVTNPYWIMANQFQRQTKDHLLGTAVLRYQFFDWLYLQGRANMDYLVVPYEANNATGTASIAAAPTGLFNGTYTTNNTTTRQMNLDFLLGGGHRWGDFSFDASVGGNNYPSYYQNFSESVTNFYLRGLYTINNGVTPTTSYTVTKQTINSLYGTAELAYKNFLYLNVTGRDDWFSVFNTQNDRYFYPSISGSFVFSELLTNTPWLNFGKIRASFAQTGSQGTVGAYSTNLTYGLTPNTFNGIPLGTINGTSSPNADIKPFGVKEQEIGIELHMFNSRVNLDMAAYDKKTTNQAVPISISASTGYSTTLVNLGGLDNKGLEFNLELIPVQNKNITWRTAFNTAFNSSKVLSLANGQTQLVVGNPEFFGTIVDAVGLPLNQIQGYTYKRDAAGNVLLNNGLPVKSDLPVNFGSGLPKETGGWVNTVNYKGFVLVAQIDYKAGGKVLSSTNLNALREGLSQASLVGRVGGVVFPGVNANGTPNSTAVNAEDFYANYRTTNILDPFIYSSSFVKLRNLSLGYDLSRFMNKKYIKSMTLSAVCHNVLIIKKYTPNIDPEAITSSGDNLTGYEQASLPTVRTYGFNLNVKF